MTCARANLEIAHTVWPGRFHNRWHGSSRRSGSAQLGALQMAAAAAAGPQAEQILQANYLIGACFSNLVRIARVGGAKKQNHDDYIRDVTLLYRVL
jgi:hypothetical protein